MITFVVPVREPWLVGHLYDHYTSTHSSRSLELILSVRDPHEKFLFDRIAEAIKQGGANRLDGFSVIGYLVRKQPPWLYRVTQHSVMKEWFKVLKVRPEINVNYVGCQI